MRGPRNCLTTAQSEGRLLLALERWLGSNRMIAATRVCKLKKIITQGEGIVRARVCVYVERITTDHGRFRIVSWTRYEWLLRVITPRRQEFEWIGRGEGNASRRFFPLQLFVPPRKIIVLSYGEKKKGYSGLIRDFPLFQTRASSRSRIDLTVSESRISLWNRAYIYGSARSAFLRRKKKKKKKKKEICNKHANNLLAISKETH